MSECIKRADDLANNFLIANLNYLTALNGIMKSVLHSGLSDSLKSTNQT